MLVQRNLARTTQPARPVLQTEITNVCVFPDLLVMIVKTVLIGDVYIMSRSVVSSFKTRGAAECFRTWYNTNLRIL